MNNNNLKGTNFYTHASFNPNVWVRFVDDVYMVDDCELRGTTVLPTEIGVFKQACTLKIKSNSSQFINLAADGASPLWEDLTPPVVVINGNSIFSIGSGAGVGSLGVTNSVFLGFDTGQNAPNANDSIFLGTNAGTDATNAANSMFLGTNAGRNASGAYSSTFIGINAGQDAINAFQGVFIGGGAGFQATGADDGVFMGYQSGYQAANAAFSVFLGNQAGYLAINAAGAVFLGANSGDHATNAIGSFFMGTNSGKNATNASQSIFIGNNAGINDTVDNTLSGSSILLGNSTSTGGFSDSIAMGQGATNTMTNEVYIADNLVNVNIGGVHYQFPVVQGGAGTKLTNNGAGVLSWT